MMPGMKLTRPDTDTPDLVWTVVSITGPNPSPGRPRRPAVYDLTAVDADGARVWEHTTDAAERLVPLATAEAGQ